MKNKKASQEGVQLTGLEAFRYLSQVNQTPDYDKKAAEVATLLRKKDVNVDELKEYFDILLYGLFKDMTMDEFFELITLYLHRKAGKCDSRPKEHTLTVYDGEKLVLERRDNAFVLTKPGKC